MLFWRVAACGDHKGNCFFFFDTVSFQFADFLKPGIVVDVVSVVLGTLFIHDVGISVFCTCIDSCTWLVIAGVGYGFVFVNFLNFDQAEQFRNCGVP